MQAFESEACRVWTGALGAPLHSIEDAEQHELDVVPFSLQIWVNSGANTSSVSVLSPSRQGLYLVKSPGIGLNPGRFQPSQSILLPVDALSCFSMYCPSPFVSTVLAVLDVDDTRQQGYFFGRVRRAALKVSSRGEMQQASEQDKGAFYDTEVAEELLAALHSAFPKVPLSSLAKECLAKRERSCRSAGMKLGEMVKRRKTLSAKAFYGAKAMKPTPAGSVGGQLSDSSWQSFYEKLQFRVSHSLMCQLEGSAPISSSFPRQQEAFEFADQIAALRRRMKVSHGDDGDCNDCMPRVFSFESAGDGKRRFLVASFAEFWKNYKKTRADQRHVYEIIREGVPCRLYFDLEFKRAINTGVDGNSLVAQLISLLQLQLFRRHGVRVRHRDIYQLDSSTPAKFSRHLIFHLPDGALFVNNLHAGAFVREFISDLVVSSDDDLETSDQLFSPFLVNTETQDDPVDKKQLFIDTGVYTRNRMFRVLGSSKFKKQAVLRPFNTPSSTPGELDEELFVKTLVCPYPSLEAMEKRCRLLRCEPSPESSRRTRRFASGANTSTTSSVECRKSPYPTLDAFIRSQATKGGVQGEIRAIQMLMTSNTVLANLPGHEPEREQPEDADSLIQSHPWMVIYHMARNRWCANVRRPHKSNNVMFIVDIEQRVFYQKCHDPACQAMDFRSPAQPLPSSVDLNVDAIERA